MPILARWVLQKEKLETILLRVISKSDWYDQKARLDRDVGEDMKEKFTFVYGSKFQGFVSFGMNRLAHQLHVSDAA